jgi:hypothetical protein
MNSITIRSSDPMAPAQKAAQTFFVVMLVGTGSVYGVDHVDHWRSHLKSRVPVHFEKAQGAQGVAGRFDVRSPIEHLENIRAVLKPAISDLASVFDISRQAVYKWLSSSSTPEPDKLARIEVLSQIADTFKGAEVARAGSLLKMKSFEGRSLLDIVKAGGDWHEAVSVLITESKAMEAAYNRSGLALSKAKPTSDWLSEHSVPTLSDDA